MVTDSPVSTNKFHIPVLAFARIGKDAIWSPAITVSVLLTSLPSKEEHVRYTIRRGYSAALLPPVNFMDVSLPVINISDFKRQRFFNAIDGSVTVNPSSRSLLATVFSPPLKSDALRAFAPSDV